MSESEREAIVKRISAELATSSGKFYLQITLLLAEEKKSQPAKQ